jgi:hypothetical protein
VASSREPCDKPTFAAFSRGGQGVAFHARTADRDAREPLPHRSGRARHRRSLQLRPRPHGWLDASHDHRRVVWYATLAASQRRRGIFMPASTSRSPTRLAVLVLLAVLVGGCADKGTTSAAGSQATTTSTTVAPTTTTVPPITAKELAWLKAIPKVRMKIDKSYQTIRNLTTSGMLMLANSLRSCSRELARGGPPNDRLEPVYVLVKKACKQYDKGAACFTTAARIGIPFAGSPEDRRRDKALDCGFAVQGKGTVLLADAENKGAVIKAEVG